MSKTIATTPWLVRMEYSPFTAEGTRVFPLIYLSVETYAVLRFGKQVVTDGIRPAVHMVL